MALQTSGAISLNDIHVEAGGTTGTLASINDADIRGLISKTAGTTMSFSEWYGASSLLGLAAQSNNTTGPTTGTTVTLPSSTTGDLAIATIMGSTVITAVNYSYLTVNTPSGWTALSPSQFHILGAYTKAEFYVYHAMLVCYKVLGAGETSFTVSTSGVSGSNPYFCTHVQVYRPTSAISTVTANDVSTASSNTINCSAASSSVIAIGASFSQYSITHTWGAGPTYNTNILDNLTQYASRNLRASSYFQSTASPSNVTWSSTTDSASRYVSGYLEVS